MRVLPPIIGSLIKDEKFRDNVFILVLFILSLLKLVLVSGNEIVANSADTLAYVRLSRSYWSGPQFPYRPAGYPTWIAIVHATGIPLRIAAEFLLLFSSWVFVSALRKIGFWRLVASAVFVSVVFHPFSFSMLDKAMSETFYAPMLILALSFATIALHASSENRNSAIGNSILSGLCFAVLWHTREEYLWLLAILVQLFISAAAMFYLQKMRGTALLKPVLITVLPLIIAMTAVNISINSYNYHKYSYWGPTNTQPAWINGALTALTRIKPSHPIRYAAITKEALEMAYRVSPTLARMKVYFDQHENQYVGVKGEIGTANFVFYLMRALDSLSTKNLAGQRKICTDIEKEINIAIKNDKIPSRPVFINPRVDPAFSVWLPYWPSSFLNTCKLLFHQYNPFPDNHPVMLQDRIQSFNKIANRRINQVLKGPMRGWVAMPSHKIERIELRPIEVDKNQLQAIKLTILSSTCKFDHRPDIENRYKQDGTYRHIIGFTLPALFGRFSLHNLSLVLDLEDGSHVPIMPLDKSKPLAFTVPGSAQVGCCYIEDFPLNITNFQRRLIHIQTIIASLYAKGLFGLSLMAGPLALLVSLWVRKLRFFKAIWIVVLANLVLMTLTGNLFYSVIDASAWPIVNDTRYLFSIMLVYSSFIVLLYGSLFQSAIDRCSDSE